MKAVILAAGYGTRLQDSAKGTRYEQLFSKTPKPLIPVAGKPAIDYVTDKLLEAGVEEIIVVTNETFYGRFIEWKKRYKHGIGIINDASTNNDNRKGAVRDLAIAVGRDSRVRCPIVNDSVFVLPVDRLFEFSLKDMLAYHKAKQAATITMYDVKDKEIAKKHGVISIDDTGRVIDFMEKPKKPSSTFTSPAIYLLTKSALDKLPQYFKEGNPSDPIGRFIMWLYKQEPVYAFHAKGYLLDLGSLDSYRQAEAFFRTRK